LDQRCSTEVGRHATSPDIPRLEWTNYGDALLVSWWGEGFPQGGK
ncbi:hypothetical protein Tsubulata_041210, partial [Turnera subulata]